MLNVRSAQPADLESITEIYNEAIRTTTATFDTQPKTVEEQGHWFESHGAKHPILVRIIVETELAIRNSAPLRRNLVARPAPFPATAQEPDRLQGGQIAQGGPLAHPGDLAAFLGRDAATLSYQVEELTKSGREFLRSVRWRQRQHIGRLRRTHLEVGDKRTAPPTCFR